MLSYFMKQITERSPTCTVRFISAKTSSLTANPGEYTYYATQPFEVGSVVVLASKNGFALAEVQPPEHCSVAPNAQHIVIAKAFLPEWEKKKYERRKKELMARAIARLKELETLHGIAYAAREDAQMRQMKEELVTAGVRFPSYHFDTDQEKSGKVYPADTGQEDYRFPPSSSHRVTVKPI